MIKTTKPKTVYQEAQEKLAESFRNMQVHAVAELLVEQRRHSAKVDAIDEAVEAIEEATNDEELSAAIRKGGDPTIMMKGVSRY